MSKKAEIMQLREELDMMVAEYVDHYDTYTEQESKYFIKNIQDKQKQIFNLERGKKNGKK